MTIDYKSTVFLPKTTFPMRANLPKREPGLLERWQQIDLYRRQQESAADLEKFILHDGPPYANGHLHIGHALNKIIKDIINRSQWMLGKAATYVPGWDCHGLPIEWKIEERLRKKGLDKDKMPILDVRAQCRTFAQQWLDVQRAEFQRLGINGDWSRPYSTMDFQAEAAIVRELGRFVMNGALYRDARPVLWSVVEKTALAEAEVEYHDRAAVSLWMRFPVVTAGTEALRGVDALVWTTTPWTVPANRALACRADIDYAVIRVTASDGLVEPGARLLVAAASAERALPAIGVSDYQVETAVPGRAVVGAISAHPLRAVGYRFEVPLLAGDFVDTDQGSGVVHMAPDHGEDDYRLCRANGISLTETVLGDGTYASDVPLFAGCHIYKVAPQVIEALRQSGALAAHREIIHSYPHSWRSKAPLIYRATAQWFISMEANGLRATALRALDTVRFIPDKSRNRLRSMVERRPDWCVSRQRLWGVPLTVFVNKQTGEPLRDQGVIDRVAAAVEKEGADVWFCADPQRFLGDEFDANDYEQVFDIADVWFDSGSSHAFVLEARDDLRSPADLYLEGSDQHRGWFQSSLLEASGSRGRAPYKAILTHGFALDDKGRKMSKSLGNVVSPQQVIDRFGADILRLWSVSADYLGDQRIGPDVLAQCAESYRRLRNTLRYLLGALADFDPQTEAIGDVAALPELERWVLHGLAEMDARVRDCFESYNPHALFAELATFCSTRLSSFYFDIRKDVLYCDSPSDRRRRACRAVMDTIFRCVSKWLAPFLCFTAEEAWLTRYPSATGSIHLERFETVPQTWGDDALAARWEVIATMRRVALAALEAARASKVIGSSLEAAPTLYAPQQMLDMLEEQPMDEICITSQLFLAAGTPPNGATTLPDVPGVGVVMERAQGEKCLRCWKILPDVGTHTHHGVCGRCDAALGLIDA